MESMRPAGISRKSFCDITGLNRCKRYYIPNEVGVMILKLMDVIDRLKLDFTTTGVVMMSCLLWMLGYCVNVMRVCRRMR